MQELKHNFIKDDIVINFEVSELLQNTIKEAEEADRQANNADFSNIARVIDVLAKEEYVSGKITKAQWNLLCEKYPEAV